MRCEGGALAKKDNMRSGPHPIIGSGIMQYDSRWVHGEKMVVCHPERSEGSYLAMPLNAVFGLNAVASTDRIGTS
jgi:hypothetical protein